MGERLKIRENDGEGVKIYWKTLIYFIKVGQKG